MWVCWRPTDKEPHFSGASRFLWGESVQHSSSCWNEEYIMWIAVCTAGGLSLVLSPWLWPNNSKAIYHCFSVNDALKSQGFCITLPQCSSCFYIGVMPSCTGHFEDLLHFAFISPRPTHCSQSVVTKLRFQEEINFCWKGLRPSKHST